MQKSYVGLIRDHSVSMRPLVRAAARDYNSTISGIKQEAAGIDTVISVIKCGVGYDGRVEREIVNSSINVLQSIPENAYIADGGSTPLLDSVGAMIELLSGVPDIGNSDVSFMVIATTDGEENSSRNWSATRLKNEIRRLQNTDRWTFAFRVPRGYGSDLISLTGIQPGNIFEWETSERGLAESTVATNQAFSNYYQGIRSGVRSTQRFYADLNVDPVVLRRTLDNVSHAVQQWTVPATQPVKQFIESVLGRGRFVIGTVFYELVKSEDVQANKVIVIKDKSTGAYYSGAAARDLLGLPHFGTVRVTNGNHGNYDIFIQSTSNNRVLPSGSNVLYWPGI